MQLPEIRDRLIQKHKGNWLKVAEQQMATVFANDPDTLMAQAKAYVALMNS